MENINLNISRGENRGGTHPQNPRVSKLGNYLGLLEIAFLIL